MKIEKHDIIIDNQIYNAEVTVPEDKDVVDIIKMYELWAELSELLSDYGCRRVNLPEFTELLFCIVKKCWRFNNVKGFRNAHTSFDCYNPQTQKTIQIKSASIGKDLTSFGPKSTWDELYFMDFFCDEKYNGSFEIYFIPDEYIYKQSVNKNQTMADQQTQNRRPRFSIKDKIIKKYNIEPIAKYNIYEL